MKAGRALLAALALPAAAARAQFFEGFDAPSFRTDPAGVEGWSFFSGDGQAAMDFRPGGEGYASILVDATRDRRGIWWALVKHKVSNGMDLARLSRPGHELRIEARIRVSHAPRRVNLHLNTQKTTDFHTHLVEFDIPDTSSWHVISMTTRDFPAQPGDTVFGQLALMDWGLERYRVDLDYLRVDVVEAARARPDEGVQVPYHPAVPDPGTFHEEARVAHDATLDFDNPDVNLDDWSVRDGAGRATLLAVGGKRYVFLRFDLSGFAGRRVADHGLLELTTRSVERAARDLKDFGLVRVVEVLGGDPRWDQRTVTPETLLRGEPLGTVLNTQMIIDWPVSEGDRAKTRFTISKPVLQRMIDGRTLGLALEPLGSIHASFYSLENEGGRLAPRLLFDVE